MNNSQKQNYRQLFEAAYSQFHTEHHRQLDPIHIVHEYSDPRDQEIAGLLSALLAYGNVKTIVSSIRKALIPFGGSPYSFLKSEDPIEGNWRGFRHRFTTGTDLEILFYRLRKIYAHYPSLEDFFLEGMSKNICMKGAMSSFVRRFHYIPLSSELSLQESKRRRQLSYLLSDPLDGSACKRLNLFMRWMVRPADGIDLGLWTRVSPSVLFLPVDTHLLKTLKILGWVDVESATWRVVELATEQLRRLSPEDPIRFDFALCHLSMSRESLHSLEKSLKRSHAPVERRPLYQESPQRGLRRSIRL